MPNKALRIALIGANGGIGSEMARLFHEHGYADVIRVVRKVKPEMVAGISPTQALCDFVPENCDAVVNFAGISQAMLACKNGAASTIHIVGETIGPVADSIMKTAAHMKAKGFGRIINVSSVVAHMPTRGVAAYAAAKAAVEAYTRAAASEMAPWATANTIALGYFDAGMIRMVPEQHVQKVIDATPMKRLGVVEADLFGVVEFLLSDASRFVTGQTIHVNGGLHAGK